MFQLETFLGTSFSPHYSNMSPDSEQNKRLENFNVFVLFLNTYVNIFL